MSVISARQTETFTDDDGNVYVYHDSFWWTKTGQIVRWSIFLGLFALIMAYLLGGYLHAKRRIARGQAPLPYHRWMLGRRERARFDPNYQNPSNYYYTPYPQQGQYGMHPMPPPMYDPNAPMPPSYQPPEGATKIDPSQNSQPTTRPAEASDSSPSYYAPPPGPPPAAH
ncbi:chitin synthesis regulation, resistance to congo red-domain-containing protein [Xylogone sp. PMI_703]|nr:chitin synthesis regulation, resistance to congo red-domain-containing protein [Xylogone sp. PMI_703]